MKPKATAMKRVLLFLAAFAAAPNNGQAADTPPLLKPEDFLRHAAAPEATVTFINPEGSLLDGGFWMAYPQGPATHLEPWYPGVNVLRKLEERGSWALQETAVMAAVLRTHQREKDMVVGRGRRRTRRVVLDLGAHVGYFSLLAAAHGCTVTAVEPNPLHAGLLRLAAATNNAKAGDAVTVVETLVGNTTAPQRFNGFQVISEDASGPVSPPDATSTNSSSSTTTTTSTSQSISTVSLEQLIKRATATTILSEVGSEGEVLFMKVDMEGQEAAVLRSASPAELARVGHIYLELTTHDNGGSGHMGASGHRFLPAAQDAPELLRAAGFTLYTNLFLETATGTTTTTTTTEGGEGEG
jgi:FkbM family methyltransferase